MKENLTKRQEYYLINRIGRNYVRKNFPLHKEMVGFQTSIKHLQEKLKDAHGLDVEVIESARKLSITVTLTHEPK